MDRSTLLRQLGSAGACFGFVLACGDGINRGAPTACTDGDPSLQHHGGTCLCCHAEFGAAGSVDPSGAPVASLVVTAADGQVATMTPNSYGNFLRHFSLAPPLRVRVVGVDGTTLAMTRDAPSGDCNGCHAVGGEAPPIHGPP